MNAKIAPEFLFNATNYQRWWDTNNIIFSFDCTILYSNRSRYGNFDKFLMFKAARVKWFNGLNYMICVRTVTSCLLSSGCKIQINNNIFTGAQNERCSLTAMVLCGMCVCYAMEQFELNLLNGENHTATVTIAMIAILCANAEFKCMLQLSNSILIVFQKRLL